MVSRNVVSRHVVSRHVVSLNLRGSLPVDPQDLLLPGRLSAPHDGVDGAVLVLRLLLLLVLLLEVLLLLLLALLGIVVGVLGLVRGLSHHLQAVVVSRLVSWHSA